MSIWLNLYHLARNIISYLSSGEPLPELPSPDTTIDKLEAAYDASTLTLTIKPLKNIILTPIGSTNSLEPLLDDHHIIILSDASEYLDALQVGDIVVWQRQGSSVIHCVVEVGQDSLGWYFETRGLHPLIAKDPYRLRRENLKYIALGVLWVKKKAN